MPLIRALFGWIGRRMEVRQPYLQGERLNQASWGNQGTGLIPAVLLLAALPLIALLVLIGLLYEGAIRIDRARVLPRAVHWVLAGIVGSVIVVALVTVVIRWLGPPLI